MAASIYSKVSSVFRPGLFSNKVAIVTGGGTGIGKAITQELLYLGCKVVVASRKFDRLSKAANEMKSSLPKDTTADIKAIQCNIRKEEEVKSLMKSTVEEFGRIDYLVNNGGGQFPSPFANISLKGWNAVIETNLTGTFLCCREAHQNWMGEHGGSIVNIIVDLWNGFPMMGHTAAARAGIENFTRTCAQEWAQHGIRINCVAPGTVWSETAAANYADPSIFEGAIPAVPAKRLGKVEEISAAVCYLLSPGAAYVTGDTIKVDGGSGLQGFSGKFVLPDHDNMPPYTWEEDIKKRKEEEEDAHTRTGPQSKL
ncbi:peroxisomal trans-2-enoyl-CoA reductase-like [Amphiura filiformis]|uniref:peroxisomal trans-2-enoyl-CoA reductase-like n=1 Tax=Amphiura filiformis TaxID=82378 RepID=UPI003B223D53